MTHVRVISCSSRNSAHAKFGLQLNPISYKLHTQHIEDNSAVRFACRLMMQGPGKLQQQVGSVLSAVLNAQWPVPRWPMHVFTAGACFCLLTSSICHLFGCCKLHISQVCVLSQLTE